MRAFSAIAAALLLTGAASATDKSIEIVYSQSDLVDPARVEALQTRIERAAKRVCDARTLIERRNAEQCIQDAEARANAQLARAVAAVGVITVATR